MSAVAIQLRVDIRSRDQRRSGVSVANSGSLGAAFSRSPRFSPSTGFTRPSVNPRSCWARSVRLSQKVRRRHGKAMVRFSINIRRRLSRLSCSPRWRKWKATGIPSLSPTGAGSGHGIPGKSTARLPPRSVCFNLPTEPLPKRENTAFAIIRFWLRDRGTIRALAGSIAFIAEISPAMPSRWLPPIFIRTSPRFCAIVWIKPRQSKKTGWRRSFIFAA